MPYSRRRHRSTLLLLLILFSFTKLLVALKCRSDEWLSNAEMKRVTRNCMRRISESTGQYNSNQNNGLPHYNHGQQHRSQQIPDSNHFNNNDYEYDDSDTDERDSNYRYKFSQQTDNYERTDDILRQRNRDRDRDRDRDRGSRTTKSPGQNDRGKYDRNRGSAPQSNLESNGSMGNRNIVAIGNHQKSNSTYDSSCVAHCFFGELNMVNGDGYPDKYKVKYLLTKDLHDLELRDFYMETIQECFFYLERQRKLDKCLYSRGLVSCMVEYAKANCEDWNDYTMIFN